eukprot:3396085-Rhodomonas_salina.1
MSSGGGVGWEWVGVGWSGMEWVGVGWSGLGVGAEKRCGGQEGLDRQHALLQVPPPPFFSPRCSVLCAVCYALWLCSEL